MQRKNCALLLGFHWRMHIQGKRTNSDRKKVNSDKNILLDVSHKDEARFQCIKQKYRSYFKK